MDRQVALIVETENQLGSAARGAIEEIFFVAMRRPNWSPSTNTRHCVELCLGPAYLMPEIFG